MSDIDAQSLIINPIHYRMLVKESLEFFVNSYVEQLVLFIRVMYGLQGSAGEVTMVSEPYTRKRLEGDPDAYKDVFNSKSAFS